METLHAPWRIEYILSPKPELKEGLFARIAQSSDDEANLVVVRDRTCFALLNRYPYNGGHLMVVPYEHVDMLQYSSQETLEEMILLVQRSQIHLQEIYRPAGFNLGMNLGESAGAGIAEHIHMHVLPRWPGDTNFMTTVAETRILPEELETTWRRMRTVFAEQ